MKTHLNTKNCTKDAFIPEQIIIIFQKFTRLQNARTSINGLYKSLINAQNKIHFAKKYYRFTRSLTQSMTNTNVIKSVLRILKAFFLSFVILIGTRQTINNIQNTYISLHTFSKRLIIGCQNS